ncbi:MAG: NADH-quinone oxidoreductase subunit H [Rhodopila sp.]
MLEALAELVAQLVHIALVLVAAPSLAGATDWFEARLAGRAGPSLLEPFQDLVRLSRKAPALPENASPVLTLAPAVSLAATLSAAALVPSITLGMALSPLADGLVVAGLLSIGRIAGCLAALDIGAAPSGRGAERSSATAVLAEPALLMFVFALALMGGSFSLDQIIGQQRDGLLLPAAASALALTSLLALVYADIAGSAPELYQDLSGIDLAIARFTSWLRQIVWINLIGALFLPIGMAGPRAGIGDSGTGLAAWLIKLVAAAFCLSVVRVMFGIPARQTLSNVLRIAALLAVLAAVIVLSSAGSA